MLLTPDMHQALCAAGSTVMCKSDMILPITGLPRGGGKGPDTDVKMEPVTDVVKGRYIALGGL